MAERKMDKRINSDLQNATQNTKDQAKRTPLETGDDEFRCLGRVSSCSTCGSEIFIFLYNFYQASQMTTDMIHLL
jgi:hypothetical protein